MIPGVGLDEWRRMTACHQRVKKRPDSALPVIHNTELDPVTSEARNRLEQRLGFTDRSCRRFGKDGLVGSNGDIISRIRYTSRRFGLVRNMLVSGLLRFRSRDRGHICAVCLDKCYGDLEMMILKCSHKYHSKCVLPWLEAHSNCPYCRNPV